jgi:hypothetical protein
MRVQDLVFRLPTAAIAALGFLAFAAALPAAAMAGSDPNLQQRIQQFIYKPAPEDLIIRKDETSPDKPAKKSGKGPRN